MCHILTICKIINVQKYSKGAKDNIYIDVDYSLNHIYEEYPCICPNCSY